MAFTAGDYSPQDDRRYYDEADRRAGGNPFGALGGGPYGRNIDPQYGAPTGQSQWLAAMLRGQQQFGGGTQSGGVGGIGGFTAPRVNLDRYRNNEIAAMERMIRLQFEGVQTELEGTLAQTELDRDFSLAQQERALRKGTREVRGNAMSRGILDSGIFLENTAEVEGAAQEQMAFTRNSAAAMIGGLQSQMALLDAQRAAQIAFERAQIERAYMMARISGF